ncbi:MAG TPA: glycosyl transferase, partial [Myxococcaceae bacterium]|nr:glycosyl transferase [Myxococcaceae bacterium]
YIRWSIIHHTCIPTPVYLGQSLINPLPLGLLGALLSPSALAFQVLGGLTAVKLVHDVAVFQLMRPGQRTPWMTVPAVLLKDVLIFVAWANGLFARSVDWRGNKLRVMAGSRLVAPASALPQTGEVPEHEPIEELLAG